MTRDAKAKHSAWRALKSGELLPTEAELARREGRDYEPVSALFERIRPERDSAQSPALSHLHPRRSRTNVSRNSYA